MQFQPQIVPLEIEKFFNMLFDNELKINRAVSLSLSLSLSLAVSMLVVLLVVFTVAIANIVPKSVETSSVWIFTNLAQ
jgi:hypothetical protein